MKNDRLEEILVGALDRVGADRAAFLEIACGGDAALEARVLELMEAHDGEPGVLEPADTGNGDRMLGRRVGSFTIDRLLASGGMGNVYVATQDDPRREVALKLMRPGVASRSALRRFRFESQVLGRLHDPNIAPVYEAGTHDDDGSSVPYFAMEYIADAQPITVYADSTKLGTRERLAMFTRVCNAVHHGHQKGVIHRDLKPSNILVDGSGEPKVIDFGVARATDTDIAITTMGTDVGQLVGTLAYMSPEQCAGDVNDVDTRSDVYGLGVVLYELLCGHGPYDLSRVPFPEAARMIREEPPARPSTVNRALRGDVETIALKALEKDRDRRYQSAADLGRDIDLYLRGEGIEARPASAAYRVRTFARRHKVASAVLVMLLVAVPALAVATVIATTSAERARDAQRAAETARGEAETAQREAETITEFVIEALVGADPLQGGTDDFLVVAAMEQAIEQLDTGELKSQPELEATLRATIARVLQGNRRFDQAVEQAERELEIRRTLHPGDHPDVADSLNGLALRLDSAARPLEALTTWEACLAMRKRLFPAVSREVARAMHNVGYGLEKAGRVEEAIPVMEAALAMKRRLVKEQDDRWVADAMSSLAFMLRHAGRDAEALPLAQGALDMVQRLYGEAYDINVAFCLDGLGRCLYELGWPEKALEKHRAALEMNEELHGPDHQWGDWSRGNVAFCLETLGRSEEALPRFQARLAWLEGFLPGSSDNAMLEGTHQGLGRCMLSLDRPEEALPHARAALEIYRRRMNVITRRTAELQTELGACLAALDRSEEALPLYEEAMEINRRALPPDHPHALRTQIGMARTLVALGRYADAEPLLLDAAAHCDESEPARRWHWSTVCSESIRLYEAWDAAEPGQGYDASAAEWRARMPDHAPAGR